MKLVAGMVERSLVKRRVGEALQFYPPRFKDDVIGNVGIDSERYVDKAVQAEPGTGEVVSAALCSEAIGSLALRAGTGRDDYFVGGGGHWLFFPVRML